MGNIKSTNRNFAISERLTRRGEFKNVSEKGKVFKDNGIVSYVLLNGRQSSRLGIIVKKKIGNAVKRNGIKRFFREAFRINKGDLTHGVDIIIIPCLTSKWITYLSAEEFFRKLVEYIKNDD
jgi:ribonuclease P protein component